MDRRQGEDTLAKKLFAEDDPSADKTGEQTPSAQDLLEIWMFHKFFWQDGKFFWKEGFSLENEISFFWIFENGVRGVGSRPGGHGDWVISCYSALAAGRGLSCAKKLRKTLFLTQRD